MDKKEEILRKSRNSNKDEGMEFAENKGRKIGFAALSVIFVFIIFFNVFLGKKSYEVAG